MLDGRECGQNMKRRYLETLSSFYSWTMKRPRLEEITGNPAAVVLEEIPKKVQPRPDCATWSKGKEIVHRVANPRDKTIVALLAKTGCRVTEALSIQMDDVMLEEGFIRLRVRKGGKQTVVPIDEEMVRAIQRYQFTRPEDKSLQRRQNYCNLPIAGRSSRQCRSNGFLVLKILTESVSSDLVDQIHH